MAGSGVRAGSALAAGKDGSPRQWAPDALADGVVWADKEFVDVAVFGIQPGAEILVAVSR